MSPLRILTVVGARPQFIKAAMVSKAIVKHNAESPNSQIVEEIIHTGQHYDENMSDVFFREMKIPEPAVRLDCGGKSHGVMTGQMLEAIEREIVSRKPDWILVYGDTNSTLAGALAAAKLHVPVAHVEAGLRSFNKKMPEEINRILTDHVSTLLFCPTQTGVENLRQERITDGVHFVGDVMYDAALFFGEIAERESTILRTLDLRRKSYYLATIHRQENTDDPDRLQSILSAFARLPLPVVFPIHPRTRSKIRELMPGSLQCECCNSRYIDPVSFLDMIMLEKNASIIVTDSGGVQKEAYWHKVPCVTLRDETEWVETVEAGWNRVVGVDLDRIIGAVEGATNGSVPKGRPALFGEGDAADVVSDLVARQSQG
jgi:UDP-GlcNAc3NAcA epimerase